MNEMPMDETQRRARLIEWLEVILQDVQDLLLDDHVFWSLQGIVRGNPRFHQASGLFTQWILSAFVHATAIGVRRQAKVNGDSVSIRRFLREVQRYPCLVSREHYMAFYEGKEAELVECGQRDFDGVAGKAGAHV